MPYLAKPGKRINTATQIKRESSSARGYGAKWQKAAAQFKHAHPLCGQRTLNQIPVMSACYDSGRVTPAYQVDHVIPHRNNQQLFWDTDNWQSLCRSCGAAKSRAGL